MDMFSIAGAIWRHKYATIPVMLLTVLGLFYVLEIQAPTYQSTADVLLLAPKPGPNAAQIQADPSLAKINANNPYLDYGNLILVADVVIDAANAPSSQQVLASAGVQPGYQVALSTAVDNPAVIQVTGSGSSAPAAIRSAQLVAGQVSSTLRQLQAAKDVNPSYMITADEFVKPQQASKTISGKLRTSAGFLALGVLLLLVAVSIAESVAKRRQDQGGQDADDHETEGRIARRQVTNEPVDYDAGSRGSRAGSRGPSAYSEMTELEERTWPVVDRRTY